VHQQVSLIILRARHKPYALHVALRVVFICSAHSLHVAYTARERGSPLDVRARDFIDRRADAMTDRLPPNLLALFAPRPPLRWVQPSDHAAQDRRTATISGVAAFLPALAAYRDADNYKPTESWLQMRDRKKLEHKAKVEKSLIEGPKKC
jgi:hypothetical protein